MALHRPVNQPRLNQRQVYSLTWLLSKPTPAPAAPHPPLQRPGRQRVPHARHAVRQAVVGAVHVEQRQVQPTGVRHERPAIRGNTWQQVPVTVEPTPYTCDSTDTAFLCGLLGGRREHTYCMM